MKNDKLPRSYHVGKWGILYWQEGMSMFLGSKEITVHGYVWWYPWNWVMFFIALFVCVPYRAVRRTFRKR